MLLSLFCGPGGLDLGFERAGFEIGLAFDKKTDCVLSYNLNRARPSSAHCRDARDIDLALLDELWGGTFRPKGVIGGPPCQSFTQANRNVSKDDPRHKLPLTYANLVKSLNERTPLHFFVFENVPGLHSPEHFHRLLELEGKLEAAGFRLFRAILNAKDYATPQNRERLFLVGLNAGLYPTTEWSAPGPTTVGPGALTVASAIADLPEPFRFERGADPTDFPFHRNHWCMKPKSIKFATEGALIPGNGNNRSFKTLAWDRPSPTVAYGNREVHIHPNCKRRLSVFEAMRLQGFPDSYELVGTLSSQITQVSEAVPPRMAEAVARSLTVALGMPARLGNGDHALIPASLGVAHVRQAKRSKHQCRSLQPKEAL